mmetsp:Transcript_4679/g.5422  ORF Transcript_4679/g.5422 Transcript_4679/m.5422 type:complete len:259 (+) Transcript_4679:183-959(+)|eukprot:CAMPEP_0197843794 /NCGR_PEP_ID=MMETSP1438-20131217/731_1 /TAXON_ID=1461541 /ORGANISM="Pterosperma sp., Strain CCMP1384" /LENGTH=258 /DNA_ID=CAMNT_0043454179 /DNA_START=173 /DNA_END=949 /DNA_ORIENTATION=-
MDPMKIFAGRLKAAEGSYFKPEQESTILRHREQLKKEGRLDKIVISAQNSGDVLPEILSHTMPMNRPEHRIKVVDKGYNAFQPDKARNAGYDLTRRPSIYDNLQGAAFKAPRSKWASATLDGTSLFEAKKAQQLMLDEKARKLERKARLIHVGAKLEAQPVLKLAGIPLKLLPEPTVGKALFWGTVLCVWGGSAAATAVCKALDINTVEDFKPRFREFLSPMASSMYQAGSGVREKVLDGELAMDTGSMSYKLRETFR